MSTSSWILYTAKKWFNTVGPLTAVMYLYFTNTLIFLSFCLIAIVKQFFFFFFLKFRNTMIKQKYLHIWHTDRRRKCIHFFFRLFGSTRSHLAVESNNCLAEFYIHYLACLYEYDLDHKFDSHPRQKPHWCQPGRCGEFLENYVWDFHSPAFTLSKITVWSKYYK